MLVFIGYLFEDSNRFLSLNGLIRISVVYMAPLCTLPVPVRKIHFSQDSQIHEVQVRKSYFVPFEPIEWLENLHMAKTDLELGKCVPNFLYVSWSAFYSQIQLWEGRKIIC